MISIDLTSLAQALVGIATAVISGFVIPWIKAKAGEARAANLMKWARIGVQAAEQVFHGRTDAGKEKFAYVEQFLARHGFKLDTAEVEQAIEAAVYELTGGVATAELKIPSGVALVEVPYEEDVSENTSVSG